MKEKYVGISGYSGVDRMGSVGHSTDQLELIASIEGLIREFSEKVETLDRKAELIRLERTITNETLINLKTLLDIAKGESNG